MSDDLEESVFDARLSAVTVLEESDIMPSGHPTATMRVPEVAKLLGTGTHSVREGIRRGQIPVIHVGRKILIPRQKLMAMLGLEESAPPVESVPDVSVEEKKPLLWG